MRSFVLFQLIVLLLFFFIGIDFVVDKLLRKKWSYSLAIEFSVFLKISNCDNSFA